MLIDCFRIVFNSLNGGNLPVPQAPAPATQPAAQPPAPLGNLDLSQILRTLAENSNAGAAPAAPGTTQPGAANNGQNPDAGGDEQGNNQGSGGAGGDGSNNDNNDNDRMEE